MGPPKKVEAIALVFDGGKASSADTEFFEKSKQCLSRILERKILHHSPDQIGLIVVGSETSESDYENVSCPFDLQLPTLDMLRFVRNELQPTNWKSDWLSGVVLAADKLGISVFEKKKIVVLSNLTSGISKKTAKIVVNHLKMMGLSVTFIGPCNLREMLEETEGPSKRAKMETPEIDDDTKQFLTNLWNELDEKLEISDVDLALQQLTLMPMNQTKSKAWNSELNIANIHIPISAYVKIKRTVTKPISRTKPILVANGETAEAGVSKTVPSGTLRRVMEKSYVDQEGVKVTVMPEETTKGVKYGATLLPFTDADKKAMEYKAGPKGISVLCFTKLAQLNRMFVIGQGCHIVVAPKGNEAAATALSALIQALLKVERGAIARKVYSTDRGLRLVILSPIREKIESDGEQYYKECLVMNDLAWKEGVKQVPFECLNSNVTEEQQKIVDDFVDSKNLMMADKNILGESTEALKIENTREEKNSFYLHCLVERAVNPKAVLPKSHKTDSELFNWSPAVEEICKKVEESFPITLIDDKKNKKDIFRQKYLRMNELGNEMLPPAPPPQKLDHPKPVVSENDPDCVRDVKMLFADSILPPAKALIYVLKSYISDENEKPILLACLKECIVALHAFARSVQFVKYNGWFGSLFENAPDVGGIADFVLSLREPYGSIDDNTTAKNNHPESQQQALRDAADIERSQLLMDIF